MFKKTILFSALALETASSSSSCQATRLLACAETYGLLEAAARFLSGSVFGWSMVPVLTAEVKLIGLSDVDGPFLGNNEVENK